MSPAVVLDDAARQDVIRQVLADSRRVLAELGTLLDTGIEEHQLLDGLRRVLADVERPPAPREWHLYRDSRPGDVPDLTTATWPHVCQERTTTTYHDVRHTYTCTRLIGHTGRHAAGDSCYIVAVWEQAEPEVLGAVEGAA